MRYVLGALGLLQLVLLPFNVYYGVSNGWSFIAAAMNVVAAYWALKAAAEV